MSSNSVQPGDLLAGKYRVERVLGAGGMGYVVAARHLQLDQMVAMKFLRKAALDSAEAGARFLREAKAVVKLRNEHVAKVYDVGTLESGEPYIVMEHLDGCDLAALAKQRGPLPASEACEYVMQACEALAEAHSIGIVHRDVKLANIFITRGPAGGPLVKVLDFGISKTNPFGESEHGMTRTASMLGSPRFMSPEQMRDPRAVDGRSDIWSLGVVLYRLIAGRPPFEAEALGGLLNMVMHEQQAPLSAFCSDLPPGFDAVIARCLEKDPAMRFASVAELAYALAPYCIDPTRARTGADRIAAVLNLPLIPNTGDRTAMLFAPPSRESMPPGVSDTGTAAPWAGTQSGSRSRGNATTIWLGVLLTVILVGTAIFAKLRYDATRANEGTTTATAAPVPTPAPTPAPTPRTEPTPRAEAAPIAPQTEVAPVAPIHLEPGTPMILGASEQPGAAGAATAAPKPHRAVAPRGNNARPAPRPKAPAASPVPSKNEDSIPTTRD